MMVTASAKAQKSIEIAKEKKAKIAITTQIAKWHEKYSQHRPLYIYSELHHLVGPVVQNGSLF
jgi:ribosomal protein S17